MGFGEFRKMALGSGFRLFMLRKLPSAHFTGVRLAELESDHAVVTVPYKWFSQNPFKSIYFASQAMAAEMSTGILAMAHIHGSKPRVSMLVTSMEAKFLKKATEKIYFTCIDGEAIRAAIEETKRSGEAVSLVTESIGKTAAGVEVSRFRVEWGFKRSSL